MNPIVTVGLDSDGSVVIRIAKPPRIQRMEAIQRELEDLGLLDGADDTKHESGVPEPARRIGYRV